MRTLYCFRSEKDEQLRGFTDDSTGSKLPAESGPWILDREMPAEGEWNHPASRAVVLAGIAENGFSLWDDPTRSQGSAKPVIESDRVEGTTVYDLEGKAIGTIKRLLIEKVSGRVLYVDMVFGGFLGLGAHHHTIPWGKLSYDTSLGGYRTDITEAEVRGAPAFAGDDEIWPDRKREQNTYDYWRMPPHWGGF